MKMIQVQKLTQEAFAPFGEVLTTEGREAGGNPASPFVVSPGGGDRWADVHQSDADAAP